MKKLERNATHIREKSHDCLIGEMGGKKMKFLYTCRNGNESCHTSIFDGNDWNIVFTMSDLGVMPNLQFYIESDQSRLERANSLFEKAENMCKLILE